MAIVSFLISLTGAVMLLLFSVRMVRTGIERSFGASFQRILTSSTSLTGAGITGIVLAVLLQSSAAVALLTAGFATSGFLGFGSGLAIVLGGDLGSALIIQVLSFRLDWLVPLLLAFGGWLFVKVEAKRWRQTGRIVMGIALILISLRFLREAMDPIRDSTFLPAISGYLASDFVTAFLVGAVLAFVMHSSVAAILMCVTLVHIDAVPFTAGVSLILGANLGGAFIPLSLTRGMPAKARRIPLANLILRGGLALTVLLSVNLAGKAEALQIVGPGQSLIYVHIGFNLLLFLAVLPFCRLLEEPTRRILPDAGQSAAPVAFEAPSTALDYNVIDNPRLAMASLKRELLRMSELIETMLTPVIDMYQTGDKLQIRAIRDLDETVNATLSDIRNYVAALPVAHYSKAELKQARGLMEYAIRLEIAGDVISSRLTAIANEKRNEHLDLSKEGWSELVAMYEAIMANLKLAANVLISDDLESARLLVTEKTELKRAEYSSRKRHLKRLQSGRADSLESSDVHLETLRAFRDLNSHISAIAYPILYRNGQLLETRLIQEMDRAEV